MWIAIHGACVAVALAANYAPSALQSEFLAVVGPYLSSLAFDPNGAPVYMTHGEYADVDWRLEWLAEGADETDEGSWQVAIPWSTNRLGWARHREQALLREFGELSVDAESPDADMRTADLARAIAAFLREQKQLPVRSVRLVRHTLQPPEAVASPDPQERDPNSALYFEVVYQADVVIDNGSVEIIRRASAGEEARVGGAGS